MIVAKAGDKQKYELQLLVETFLIVGKILEAKDGLALHQICQITQITKNRAFRMLATLIQCGILEKDAQGNYKVGITSIENAHKILAQASTLDKARLIMESLAWTTNEAVYFSKYTGTEAVLVDFVDCCQSIKATSFIGAAMQFPPVTRGTAGAKCGDIIVDTGSLSAEVTTVSMPYVNEHGLEIGALVVLAPTYRMTPNRIKTEIIPALRDVMPHQHMQLHDILQNMLPMYPSTGHEYAKYPHLVSGTSTKKSEAGAMARSLSQ
jgi:DNA-binding IclR family transcriptional regulator